MFQGSCDSTWILVLCKDYLHQGRIKIYSSRLEPETRPINLLLHCIISLMREQRQVYSPIYGELAGTHLHPLESVWQDHPAFPRVGSSMSAFFCLSIKARTHILNAHIHAHTHAHSLICIRTHSHTLTHSYTCAHTHTDLHVHTPCILLVRKKFSSPFYVLLADLKIKLTWDRLTRKIKQKFDKMY